jgi:phospholipase/lecithinase/hemolysin
VFFGGLVFSAHATFSSLYVFGDSISTTTTNNDGPLQDYYGQRYCNGRTWVEVLAQRQGLGANSITNVHWNYSSNNQSFYGHDSALLVANVANFVAPANATNCLFVVWVNNADFTFDLEDANVGNAATAPQHGTNLTAWTTASNQHLTNHFKAITNLYAKGARILIVPNAVDLTAIPKNNAGSSAYNAFVRQRIIDFNAAYAAMLNQIKANSPGLKIYVPDMFFLLDDALTNAAAYGLTNALYNGLSIDAIDAFGYGILPDANLNGPGANYIFWDPFSPSARFNEVAADIVQQMISPVQFSGVTPMNGSNRLEAVNMPVGLNGSVLLATNLVQTNWLTNGSFSSLMLTQPVFVPISGPQQFYKLKFPYQWTWP